MLKLETMYDVGSERYFISHSEAMPGMHPKGDTSTRFRDKDATLFSRELLPSSSRGPRCVADADLVECQIVPNAPDLTQELLGSSYQLASVSKSVSCDYSARASMGQQTPRNDLRVQMLEFFLWNMRNLDLRTQNARQEQVAGSEKPQSRSQAFAPLNKHQSALHIQDANSIREWSYAWQVSMTK